MDQYIFGYGSLIEQASRMITVPNAKKAFPAKVKGFSRGWWARTKVSGFSTTYLGCLEYDSIFIKDFERQDSTNGVLFQVTQEEIDQLDLREKNYKRTHVPADHVFMYGADLPGEKEVWLYVNEFVDQDDFLQSLPSKEFPIVQSYVDICMNGCFEIENNFKEAREAGYLSEFLSTTIFWSRYWANDRIFPRRPHTHCKNAFLIDQTLQDSLPDRTIFDQIYIE